MRAHRTGALLKTSGSSRTAQRSAAWFSFGNGMVVGLSDLDTSSALRHSTKLATPSREREQMTASREPTDGNLQPVFYFCHGFAGSCSDENGQIPLNFHYHVDDEKPQ